MGIMRPTARSKNAEGREMRSSLFDVIVFHSSVPIAGIVSKCFRKIAVVR